MFLDPAQFRPGSLSARVSAWREIVRGSPRAEEVLRVVTHGASFGAYAQPFEGRYAGVQYSGDVRPPPRVFENHPVVAAPEFNGFVRTKVEELLANGGARRLGRVGDSPPPRVVLPLGVEPKKPRLICDARYVNQWQRPPKFRLDRLLDLVRAAKEAGGDLLSVWDHKSGYFHVMLDTESQELFGFEFDGYWHVYTVLPFGWSVSPYVYQLLSSHISRYLRQLGVNDFCYLDDSATVSPALAAPHHSYIKGVVLTAAGYFVELDKSHILPALEQQWLGFQVDLDYSISCCLYQIPFTGFGDNSGNVKIMN